MKTGIRAILLRWLKQIGDFLLLPLRMEIGIALLMLWSAKALEAVLNADWGLLSARKALFVSLLLYHFGLLLAICVHVHIVLDGLVSRKWKKVIGIIYYLITVLGFLFGAAILTVRFHDQFRYAIRWFLE
jgi:hypothetical protein